eukprot:jgi/Astpho2/9360/Aster-07296
MAGTVPETVLKKRKRNEQWEQTKAAQVADKKAKSKDKRKDIFKRAEQYVKEYRQQEQDLIRLKREAKTKNGFYVEPEAKMAFVIRIRGINDMHPKTRKIMQLLRLKQIHNGVFIKINKATVNMLKRVEPYVAWGYPNLKTVKELIYKRGYGKVNKNRIPLTDNSIIESVLGKYNIICIEDLIHEIYTVGPAFKQASNFLWPVKLSSAKVSTLSTDMGVDTQLHVKSKVTDPSAVNKLERKLTMTLKRNKLSEAELLQDELERHVTLPPDSDEFPLFHLIPKDLLISKGKDSVLLPPQYRQFYTKLEENPKVALQVAKDVTIAVFQAARTKLGDSAVVCHPPKSLLDDPEVRSKCLWQNMRIVQPYPEEQDDLGEELFGVEPNFVPRDSLDMDSHQVSAGFVERLMSQVLILYAAQYLGLCRKPVRLPSPWEGGAIVQAVLKALVLAVQMCQEMRHILGICDFIGFWSQEGWALEYLQELRGGLS